jgi:glutamate--cysteine ligase
MTFVDEDEAAQHIKGICLKTGPPARVGVELEWLVRDVRDPRLPVSAERLATAVRPLMPTRAGGAASQRVYGQRVPALPTSTWPGVLPSGAPLTAEPGGQLEISSLPAESLTDLVRATRADLAALRAAVAAAGLELAGYGLDPLRMPRRLLDLPRYAAMEAFFDAGGPWGRAMMCTTASVQVCVDAGDQSAGPSGYQWRWRLLHAIGPVLVAAFANSPLRAGRPTGWRSARQQAWTHMDPGRTRPPDLSCELRDAWSQYALDARLICIRNPDSADWSAPPGLTLRDWVRGSPNGDRAGRGARLRPPSARDLEYHLSTLFPPVRPRGHFELRMIDAQPADGWVVPLAVITALMSDSAAGEAALAATADLTAGSGEPDARKPDARGLDARGLDARGLDARGLDARGNGAAAHGPWLRAARLGPSDPQLARASRECFAAARAALDAMAVPAEITAAVDDFTERYVHRNRCPADDLLEEAE